MNSNPIKTASYVIALASVISASSCDDQSKSYSESEGARRSSATRSTDSTADAGRIQQKDQNIDLNHSIQLSQSDFRNPDTDAGTIRSLILSGTMKDPTEVTSALTAFASRCGRDGNFEDLLFIMEKIPEPSLLGGVLDRYFSNFRETHGLEEGIALLNSLGPGSKRDHATRALFSDKRIGIDQALSLISGMEFKEDRDSALSGLSHSRQWAISELIPLLETGNQKALDRFLSYSSQQATIFGEGDGNWIGNSINAVNSIDDRTQRLKMTDSMLGSVGSRDPEVGRQLLESIPGEDLGDVLAERGAMKMIESWAHRDPNSCLAYLVGQQIEPDVKNRLISRSVRQWLDTDSLNASSWIKDHVGENYSQSAISTLVHWMEQRGEDASEWQKFVEK